MTVGDDSRSIFAGGEEDAALTIVVVDVDTDGGRSVELDTTTRELEVLLTAQKMSSRMTSVWPGTVGARVVNDSNSLSCAGELLTDPPEDPGCRSAMAKWYGCHFSGRSKIRL